MLSLHLHNVIRATHNLVLSFALHVIVYISVPMPKDRADIFSAFFALRQFDFPCCTLYQIDCKVFRVYTCFFLPLVFLHRFQGCSKFQINEHGSREYISGQEKVQVQSPYKYTGVNISALFMAISHLLRY